jgi:hypothetical protein
LPRCALATPPVARLGWRRAQLARELTVQLGTCHASSTVQRPLATSRSRLSFGCAGPGRNPPLPLCVLTSLGHAQAFSPTPVDLVFGWTDFELRGEDFVVLSRLRSRPSRSPTSDLCGGTYESASPYICAHPISQLSRRHSAGVSLRPTSLGVGPPHASRHSHK